MVSKAVYTQLMPCPFHRYPPSQVKRAIRHLSASKDKHYAPSSRESASHALDCTKKAKRLKRNFNIVNLWNFFFILACLAADRGVRARPKF